MARKLRFEEPDGIYHIGSRGNNGEMMFRDEVDRMEWLRLFAKVAVKYRWVGWTYVLMGNHFHFLVQIPHGGLSRGMQVLNTSYSVRTNKRSRPDRTPRQESVLFRALGGRRPT